MRIFIAGGRGRVGSRLGELLARRGDDVVVGEPAEGVDVLTGEGLDAALTGVDVIVNVLNTGRFDAEGAREFFTTSTRRLDEAGARAGVRRHVLLSIVGVGSGTASSNGYYIGKVAQEQAPPHSALIFRPQSRITSIARHPSSPSSSCSTPA